MKIKIASTVVNRADNKKCRLLRFAFFSFAAAATLLLTVGLIHAAEQASAPGMPVETMEVRVATAKQKISAIGSLQSDESVVLSPEISGRVTKISFIEGEQISVGKLLIRLDDAVLKAQLDQAKANLTLHEADFRRADALLKDRAISQQERDTAYAHWMLDKASVELAEAQWQKTRIIAPFSGTIGLRKVSPGDYVSPGMALVNLEDTRILKVEFSVPEKYSAVIKVGQAFTLQSTARPGQEFTGEVYVINPLVDTASRTLTVRGRLDNSDGMLRPGEFAKLRLTLSSREKALFIPEQAVILGPNNNIVFKVVNSKAEMTPIQLGERSKGWVEVISGLSAGDVVVTGGHQKIGPGSPVKAIPADPTMFEEL
jgi:membrane fusion protein (multidrug efflux system)